MPDSFGPQELLQTIGASRPQPPESSTSREGLLIDRNSLFDLPPDSPDQYSQRHKLVTRVIGKVGRSAIHVLDSVEKRLERATNSSVHWVMDRAEAVRHRNDIPIPIVSETELQANLEPILKLGENNKAREIDETPFVYGVLRQIEAQLKNPTQLHAEDLQKLQDARDLIASHLQVIQEHFLPRILRFDTIADFPDFVVELPGHDTISGENVGVREVSLSDAFQVFSDLVMNNYNPTKSIYAQESPELTAAFTELVIVYKAILREKLHVSEGKIAKMRLAKTVEQRLKRHFTQNILGKSHAFHVQDEKLFYANHMPLRPMTHAENITQAAELVSTQQKDRETHIAKQDLFGEIVAPSSERMQSMPGEITQPLDRLTERLDSQILYGLEVWSPSLSLSRPRQHNGDDAQSVSIGEQLQWLDKILEGEIPLRLESGLRNYPFSKSSSHGTLSLDTLDAAHIHEDYLDSLGTIMQRVRGEFIIVTSRANENKYLNRDEAVVIVPTAYQEYAKYFQQIYPHVRWVVANKDIARHLTQFYVDMQANQQSYPLNAQQAGTSYNADVYERVMSSNPGVPSFEQVPLVPSRQIPIVDMERQLIGITSGGERSAQIAADYFTLGMHARIQDILPEETITAYRREIAQLGRRFLRDKRFIKQIPQGEIPQFSIAQLVENAGKTYFVVERRSTDNVYLLRVDGSVEFVINPWAVERAKRAYHLTDSDAEQLSRELSHVYGEISVDRRLLEVAQDNVKAALQTVSDRRQKEQLIKLQREIAKCLVYNTEAPRSRGVPLEVIEFIHQEKGIRAVGRRAYLREQILSFVPLHLQFLPEIERDQRQEQNKSSHIDQMVQEVQEGETLLITSSFIPPAIVVSLALYAKNHGLNPQQFISALMQTLYSDQNLRRGMDQAAAVAYRVALQSQEEEYEEINQDSNLSNGDQPDQDHDFEDDAWLK